MKFASPLVQTSYHSPLGPMLLAASPRALAGVWFVGQKHMPDPSHWPQDNAHPVLQEASAQLNTYFAGLSSIFDLPLDLSGGSAFAQAVWHALLGIPYGHTWSYGALSAAIGRPTAVRAVSAAVGRNPLSIIVPCHRVLGANGALTGYAGGLDRKAALLQREGVA